MAQVNIRIDDTLKEQGEELFSALGLSFSSAVSAFVSQAVREGGIPFKLSTKVDPFYSAPNNVPNDETLAAMQEVEDMISGKVKGRSYSSFSELLKEVEADV